MAYSDFTLAKVKESFGLTLEETSALFREVNEVNPSDFLTQTLAEYTTDQGIKAAKLKLLRVPTPSLFEF
ncbi:MAG TPA: hypothetical protein V6D14_18305 [Coleofasciculaceae cyanobacterium]|jgi:hypothetical protein